MRLPNWVGDAVMVLPALRALARPGDRRIAAAHPRVIPIYRASGLLDAVLPAEGASAPLRQGGRVRRESPERAVVFTEAFSGALLAYLSGSRLRMGRARRRQALFTHALPAAGRDRPAWRSYLDLALAAGGVEGPELPDFSVDPGDAARERAFALLGSDEPFIAVAPGAAYGPAKRWPLERHAALVRTLMAKGHRVVAVGGGSERRLGQALAREGALDLTGRTGLLDTLAILVRASLLVAHDSGALHLARSAGTPVIAIFGSTSAVWTGPAPHEGDILQEPVPCSPCFRRTCPLRGGDHLRCLRAIEVDAVIAAVDRRLEAAS